MDRPKVRGLALLILIAILGGPVASADEDQTAAWLRQLNGASRDTKIDTLELLGTFGQTRSEVLVRLERLLHDREPEVVAAAAAAFLSLGGDRTIVHSRLRNAKSAVRIGLARVLLGTDESDRQAIQVLLDATPADWGTAFTMSRFSPTLSNRMVDEVLSRLEALDPATPLKDDSAGVVYASLMAFSPRLAGRHAPRLLALSRTAPSPVDELAVGFLVYELGSEPGIAAALREDLDRSAGPRQAIIAVGILLKEPENARAWQMLRLALTDPDTQRVTRTAETIEWLKLEAAPLLPQLLNGLTFKERHVRWKFVDPVVGIGPAAVPAIVAFLERTSREASFPQAAWEQFHDVLQRIGSTGDATAALPIVTARVRQGDQNAITTLCSIGRREPLAETYAEILERGEGSSRRTLVDALLKFPPVHEETRAMLRTRLPEATRLYHDEALLVALRLMLVLGGDPAEVSRRLTAELRGKTFSQPGFQTAVNSLLEDLGPNAAEVLAEVPDQWKVQLSAWNSRMRVPGLAASGEQGVPLLIARLSAPNADVRDAACDALGEIGPAARSAVPRLIELLQDDAATDHVEVTPELKSLLAAGRIADLGSELVWFRAATALGRIGPEARVAIGPLEARLRDPHRRAAAYVLRGLSGMAGPDDQQLVQSVRPFLCDDRFDVHAHALSVLVRIVPNDPSTADDVRAFLKRCRLRQQSGSMVMGDWLTLRDAFAHLPRSPKLAAAVRDDLLAFESSPLVDHECRCEAAAILCRLDPSEPVARRHLEAWAASLSHFWSEDAQHTLSRLAEEQKSVPAVR